MMQKTVPSIRQITLKIDEEIWRELKIRALNKSITMKKWIMQAVADAMAREDKAQ
jgi:hypothetical protein